jgi:hypothetical protein
VGALAIKEVTYAGGLFDSSNYVEDKWGRRKALY